MNFKRGQDPHKALGIGIESQWRTFLSDFVPPEKLELLVKYAVIDSGIRQNKDTELTSKAIRVLLRLEKNFDKIVLMNSPSFLNKNKEVITAQSHQSVFSISRETLQDIQVCHNIDIKNEIDDMAYDYIIQPFNKDNIETIYIYQLYCAKTESTNNNTFSHDVKILSRYYIKEKEIDNKSDEVLKLLSDQGL